MTGIAKVVEVKIKKKYIFEIIKLVSSDGVRHTSINILVKYCNNFVCCVNALLFHFCKNQICMSSV